MASYDRTFSVIRRRPGLVDLLTRQVYGVARYRLKWATNFDAAPVGFIDSTNVGFYDDAIPRGVVEGQNIPHQVRIVFNPTTFGIPDTTSFWLELWRVDGLGVETQMSAPTLILPSGAHHGVGVVTIHGVAPTAADSTGALQIDFPRLMSDLTIHNEDGAHRLYVSTEKNGPERQLSASPLPQYGSLFATQGSIWVRASGGDAAFSATCTMAFPR